MMTLKHGVTVRSSLRSSLAVRLAGGVVALHGGAHLVGTQAAFDAARDASTVEYLGGALELGEPWLWVAGTVWAALAVAFIGIAIVMWFDRLAWRRTLVMVAIASTAACIIALWAAWIGILVNATIAGFALVSNRTT